MKGGGGTHKKKEKRKASRVEPEAASTHDHTLFFDRLVNLVPPRFYLPAADTGDLDGVPSFSAPTNPGKGVRKKKTRENLKKARETRLDPEKSSSTLDMLSRSFKKAEQTDGGGGGGGDGGGTRLGETQSATLEELRAKLHGRIEDLRGGRKGTETGGARRKRPREEREEAAEEAEKGLAFGRMKVGEEGRKRTETKKMKPEEAERANGEVGRVYSWEAAGKRAAGEKVHDDPKLIRKKMGKERRRKEKSRMQWAERGKAAEAAIKMKQKKRADNISERARDKIRHKIERRQKKLMRPGARNNAPVPGI